MKNFSLVLLTVVAVMATGCASAPPEMQAIESAAEAMGGVDAVRGATTLVIEGSGRNYRLGQNVTPDDQLPEAVVESYTLQADLAGHQVRTEVASANFRGIIGTATTGLDGDVAYNVGGNGAARVGGLAASDRQADYYHHPLTLLQAALAEDVGMAAAVRNLREDMGQTLVDITTADGAALTLHLAGDSGLPVSITSMSSNDNLGDVTISSTFGDWTEVGGLMLPTTITRRIDEFPAQEISVTNQVNVTVGDLAAPDEARSAPLPEAPAANVESQELADGVWFLAGQSHHSVLVRFADYGVLVESPQNDTRALAVIAEARELLGDTPLQYLVNTHHHFDHSGGLRAAVAEGLTVITHEINQELYEELVARPHTINPDRLAMNPQPLMIETVAGDDTFELTDGDQMLQVFRVTGDPHNGGMLAAYLPNERILIEADDYTPGRGGPSAAVLLQNVQDRGIAVDQIAPIHGQPVPFGDLVAQVAADAGN